MNRLTGAGVDAQGIDARRLQSARYLEPFLDLPSAFEMVGEAVFDDDGEPRPEDPLYSSHDLHEESHPPLQVSPVAVGAPVPEGGQELIEEVSPVAMELDGVDAGTPGHLGGELEGADEMRDLSDGELAGHHGRIPEPGHGAGSGGRANAVLTGEDPPLAGGELEGDLRPVIMYGAGQLVEPLDIYLIVHRQLGDERRDGERLYRAVHAAEAGYDQSRSPPGPGGVVPDSPFRQGAVRLGQAADAHRRHDDAVLDIELADLSRLK